MNRIPSSQRSTRLWQKMEPDIVVRAVILCIFVLLAEALNTGDNRVKCIKSVRKEYIRTIGGVVKNRQSFLIESVHHGNFGDSFIEHGERILLKRMGHLSHIYCSLQSCNVTELKIAISEDPDSLILVHGGGNFGDIWISFSPLRKKMLQDFSSTQIVFLPQTVLYRDIRNATRDASEFAKHPNVTVFVRDKPSLKYMLEVFPKTKTILCPDGAFMIGPLNGTACRPKYDVLIISRKDHEKQMGEAGTPSQAISALEANNVSVGLYDWPCFKNLKEKLPRDPRKHVAFKTMMGRKCLCSGKVIITDRLHGTIMATLLGLPYVYLDSIYGKIVRYREAFFSPRPECSDENLNSAMATTWEEAAELAVGLLTRSALHQLN